MSAASDREALASLFASHPAIPRGPGVAGSVCPTCPREINGECNSLDHAEHLADAIHAAGFTRQSRAEIQAEAVESAVARVESLYKGSVRDLEERAQDPRASKVHKARGFGRMDALATALGDLRGYAQRIREGDDRG